MSLYLRTKKLDEKTESDLIVLVNSEDAKKLSLVEGDIVAFWCDPDIDLYVKVNITHSVVPQGTIGLFSNIWERYRIPSDMTVWIDIIERPASIEFIKKKLHGEKLTEDELTEILTDIGQRKIRDIEVAYFMASFFNPGFDDDEIYWMTKGLAESGDVLDFKGLYKENQIVVDKHSIGGVASKGVTPVLVALLGAFDLVVPNTSTRAITTPAGTTDVLEVIMPMALEKEDVIRVIKEVGQCMIWGGALDLAPGDDVLINVERNLRDQSYQKMLVSIAAKKIAAGLTHVLIDIPFGPGTKVVDAENADVLGRTFHKLFERIGIKAYIHTRLASTVDGSGIGPTLEAIDILKVFERKADRPRIIEDVALDMAGKILELCGVVKDGEGRKAAQKKLDSGEATEKFWEIAMAQGATRRVSSEELKLAEITQDVIADFEGVVKYIDNKEIVKIARALGNPFIKEAGIYLHVKPGDHITNGMKLMTLYSTSREKMERGMKEFENTRIFVFKK